MPEGLAVDDKNQLQEFREPGFPKQPAGLRVLATIFSVIFHPVFVPLYVVAFLLYVHPFVFAGFPDAIGLTIDGKGIVMIQAFVAFTFFPVVSVLLLKALNFIKTIQLRSQKDRIIPFVICGIWYFWMWNVWHHKPEYPVEAVQFSLAIFIASWFGLMVNIYMKVSMHAISMGVVLAFMVLLGFENNTAMGMYISISFLVAGIVCTSRFIVSDHTPREVYTGLFVGVLAQLIAHWVG